MRKIAIMVMLLFLTGCRDWPPGEQEGFMKKCIEEAPGRSKECRCVLDRLMKRYDPDRDIPEEGVIKAVKHCLKED